MFPDFKEYQQFQQLNFKNSVGQTEYDRALNENQNLQGWAVGADLNKDFEAKKDYENFHTYFDNTNTYAAIFLAYQNLKVVVYIRWNEKLVNYCPPNKNGEPQNLEEPKENRNLPGYINYFVPDIEVIYSNDDTKSWEKTLIDEFFEKKLKGDAVGVTISSTCVNAPILRAQP